MRKVAFLSAGVAAMCLGSSFGGPIIQVGDSAYLQLNYYFQFWAQYRSFRYSQDSGGLYDFFFRRNRFNITGQLNNHVGFYFQTDAEFEGQVNKYTGQRGESRIRVLDAYVTIDPFLTTDAFHIILGKFKQTFSRENLEACLEQLTIDRGEVLPYTPWGSSRDLGAAVWGNLMNGKFQYRLMVADGREETYNPKDAFRITARVHVSLLDPEPDYGYKATYLGTGKFLTIGAAVDYQPGVAYANYPSRTDSKDYFAWTVDSFFEYPTPTGIYTLSGAYIAYDVGDAINKNPDPNLPLSTQLEGYYIKAAYMFPKKIYIGFLQPFIRYERNDFNLSNGLYSNKQYSLGFNYYINGQAVKLTLQVDKVKFDKEDPTNFALQDYTQATLGFQMLF